MPKKKYLKICDALNDYTENENGCFIFNGYKNRGYGSFCVKGIPYLAHRSSYEYKYGKIPKGKLICHSCNEPSCINPDHLYAGTHSDNGRDKRAFFHNKSNKESGTTQDFDENKKSYVRTTIYLEKKLHTKFKQYALWTDTNLSQFMRIALRDKLNQLEQEIKERR